MDPDFTGLWQKSLVKFSTLTKVYKFNKFKLALHVWHNR